MNQSLLIFIAGHFIFFIFSLQIVLKRTFIFVHLSFYVFRIVSLGLVHRYEITGQTFLYCTTALRLLINTGALLFRRALAVFAVRIYESTLVIIFY